MNWADFNTRHEDCDQAFEGFGRQLFSKWCNFTYDQQIEAIVYVGGKGGDGGVEAFARLTSGDVIGFQAKWFRDSFTANQVSQIQSSVSSAKKRHPKLAKYIVCMPFELQGSKGKANKGKSQYERWEELVKSEVELEILLWDNTRIEEVAIDMKLQDLISYWFDRSFINQSEWQRIYESKLVWFETRYLPRIHMQGNFDNLLRFYLLTKDKRGKYIHRFLGFKKTIESCLNELERLPSLHCWEKIQGEQQDLILKTSELAKRGVHYLIELVSCLRADSQIHAEYLSRWTWQFNDEAKRVIGFIEANTKEYFALSPMHRCKQHLERAIEVNNKGIRPNSQKFKTVQLPLLLVGGAGDGKTHSVLYQANSRLQDGFPALVVPAKLINPEDSTFEWLAKYLDKPGWSLTQCFQAMEASSFTSVESIGKDETEVPSRFLLVIDGLEESTRNLSWKKSLGALQALLKPFPSIQLVCTSRMHLAQKIGDSGFAFEIVEKGQNIPLHLLLKEYCREYDVNISNAPWIQWALRSAREIRLFTQLYQGKRLAENSDLATSVSKLMRGNIEQLEQVVSSHDKYGWDLEKPILLKGLIEYSRRLISTKKTSIEHDAFIELLKSSSPQMQEMTSPQLCFIVGEYVSAGLLDKRIQPAEDALEDDLVFYYAANESVLDFLVARSAFESIVPNCEGMYELPEIVLGRPEALSLLIQMLNEKCGAYIDVLALEECPFQLERIEEAQLIAISRSLREVPHHVEQWILELFLKNKTTNRRVLNSLIIPTARNLKYFSGSQFLHQAFSKMSVTDRDILWSCPDYLPANCGGAWEGYANFDLDRVDLYPEDCATGMPTLFAWGCSSVVAERVRRCRSQLAIWGSQSTSEMAILLKRFEDCNDYQVIENILVSAAGAACKTQDMTGLNELSLQCHQMFFSESPSCNTRNSVCRHAARVVVERAHAYGLIEEDFVEEARPPYLAREEFLPFVRLPEDFLEHPLHGDLEWYVAKKASDPFFEQIIENNSEYADDQDYPKKEIIEAVIDGRLEVRDDKLESIRDIWENMEQQRASREERCRIFAREASDEILNVQPFEVLDSEDSNQDTEVQDFEERLMPLLGSNQNFSRRYSSEAAALLETYRKKYLLENLTPYELRNGLILAFVKSQGWNSELFRGNPKGGEVGEVLGADVAIACEYRPETHGARSPIASYAEKYIWLAVKEVAGDFADRLPVRGFGNSDFQAVTSYHDVGGGMPDPFDGIEELAEEDGAQTFDFPSYFWSEFTPKAGTQLERSSSWVECANWPDIIKVIELEEQLRITAWIHGVEPINTVSQHARISCLLLPRSQYPIFERDALAGCMVPRSHGGDVSSSSIDGACYQSPSVSCWASWLTLCGESYESYTSIDENGDLIHINLRYLSANTHWSCNGDETNLYFPSPTFSGALGIVRGEGSKAFREFSDKEGFPVATYERLDINTDDTVEHLLLNKQRLDQLLEKEEAVAVWFCEVYREVPPELIPDESRKGNWPQRRKLFICSKVSGEDVQSLSEIEMGDKS